MQRIAESGREPASPRTDRGAAKGTVLTPAAGAAPPRVSLVRPARPVAVRHRQRLRATSRRRRHGRRRIMLATLLVVALLLPVPWLHVMGDNPLGVAWRLDGRLVVDGEVIDPPGRWSWLTVGRPKLVFEVLRDAVTGEQDVEAEDLRESAAGHRPAFAEPAAAAVGLNRAGRSIPLGLRVEAHRPVDDRYPDGVVIAAIDGVPLSDRATLAGVAAGVDGMIEFRTEDGRLFRAPGGELPYERVRLIDLAPEGLDAAIYGQLPDVWPVTWFRGLALGHSHGLMVALTTYAHAAEHDLAQGRHIAGTGGVQGNGAVSRIGGLPSKARAARDSGADVLLYPAAQGEQLVGFDAGSMKLVPVATIDEAIEWLEESPA